MSTVPAVTADQMREVDRLMISEFHIDLVQMMENAGRALAELAIDAFTPGTVVVLAGPGGNGGGGLAAARHLINRDRDVRVVLAGPEKPVLSLDTPSGLNVTTGVAADPCVAAVATMTLALPKVGLLGNGRAPQVGRLYLADISVPRALYHRIGLDVGPLFARDSIVWLDG